MEERPKRTRGRNKGGTSESSFAWVLDFLDEEPRRELIEEAYRDIASGDWNKRANWSESA